MRFRSRFTAAVCVISHKGALFGLRMNLTSVMCYEGAKR